MKKRRLLGIESGVCVWVSPYNGQIVLQSWYGNHPALTDGEVRQLIAELSLALDAAPQVRQMIADKCPVTEREGYTRSI